ncbi:MAG: hypothetical protein AAF236_01940 [Verrucomicrobiota bacterium]
MNSRRFQILLNLGVFLGGFLIFSENSSAEETVAGNHPFKDWKTSVPIAELLMRGERLAAEVSIWGDLDGETEEYSELVVSITPSRFEQGLAVAYSFPKLRAAKPRLADSEKTAFDVYLQAAEEGDTVAAIDALESWMLEQHNPDSEILAWSRKLGETLQKLASELGDRKGFLAAGQIRFDPPAISLRQREYRITATRLLMARIATNIGKKRAARLFLERDGILISADDPLASVVDAALEWQFGFRYEAKDRIDQLVGFERSRVEWADELPRLVLPAEFKSYLVWMITPDHRSSLLPSGQTQSRG